GAVDAEAAAPDEDAVGFPYHPELAHLLALEELDPVVERLVHLLLGPRLAVHGEIAGDHGIAMQAVEVLDLVAAPARQHQPVGLEQRELAHAAGAVLNSRGRLKTMLSRCLPLASTLMS